MRTIIAGSRGITFWLHVASALARARLKGITPTVVLSGCAGGVDTLGEAWAAQHGIPIERYPADWAASPKRAGLNRNIEMAHKADALVAVWDGRSSGTLHMIVTARRMGLNVYVHEVHD